ncbi:hypothetical protein BH10ACT1_BH10ACT1_03680 [soil metagenome]
MEERDLAEDLATIADLLVEPGEEVHGSCVANRKRLLSGEVVALVITGDRLIMQGIGAGWAPKGSPVSIRCDELKSFRETGLYEKRSIVNDASISLKLKTLDGRKLSLALGRGEGLLGDLLGGDVQRAGVRALMLWLERST